MATGSIHFKNQIICTCILLSITLINVLDAGIVEEKKVGACLLLPWLWPG